MAKSKPISFWPPLQNILFFTIVLLCLVSVGVSVSCPSLTTLPGTVVRCELPSSNNATTKVNCLDTNATIPKGTLARYKCEKDEMFSEDFVKCKCKGRWGRSELRRFNEFMLTCNMSDYSVDGPPELNLTTQEIHQLSSSDPSRVKDFQEDGAAYHNFYRRIHHSPSLKLNQTLSDAAQKWAEQEVSKPTLKTQDWSERWYSQNLYRFTGSTVDAREAARLAVAAWYQGAYNYNWENPSGQSAFTQVVWKSTTDLGIGVAREGNRTLVVANYWPPGNVVVENNDVIDRWAWFRENVLPPNVINETLANPNPPSTQSPSSAQINATSASPVLKS